MTATRLLLTFAFVTSSAAWPRPANRVEWGTLAFGQSGVSMLNDVA